MLKHFELCRPLQVFMLDLSSMSGIFRIDCSTWTMFASTKFCRSETEFKTRKPDTKLLKSHPFGSGANFGDSNETVTLAKV